MPKEEQLCVLDIHFGMNDKQSYTILGLRFIIQKSLIFIRLFLFAIFLRENT